ncbi:hypothetical protein L1049_007322 [Liquidambar formosana]|uniref:Uncharacterized protein n=1 Tax=Liquidambar formosana TaxID=63359 RepID=A0AAP0RIS9_LIQFO
MGGGDKGGPQSPLIPTQERIQECYDAEISEQGCCRAPVLEELKKQLWLAGPLIAVSMLQYCLQVISIMFVGHLGELPLSSASMATSFASVTGFSVLVRCFLFKFWYMGLWNVDSDLCGAPKIMQKVQVTLYDGLGLDTEAPFDWA